MADISQYSTSNLRGCSTIYFKICEGEWHGGFWLKLKGNYRGCITNASEFLKKLDDFIENIVFELNTDIEFYSVLSVKRIILTLTNDYGKQMQIDMSLSHFEKYITSVELQGYIPY